MQQTMENSSGEGKEKQDVEEEAVEDREGTTAKWRMRDRKCARRKEGEWQTGKKGKSENERER